MRSGTSNTTRLAHVTTSGISLRLLLLKQLLAFKDAGLEVYGVSAEGPWADELEQAGSPHIAIPHFTRGSSLRHDLMALKELRDVFRAHRFDIVHLHNPKPGILGKVAARLAGVPIIVNTIHGMYGMQTGPGGETVYSFMNPWVLLEAASMKLAHFDFSQNREDLDWLRRKGWLAEERSLYLGNGVDVNFYSPAKVDARKVEGLRIKYGIPHGSLVVGMVGRLVWEKGYREFFAAAERLKARHPHLVFISVGPQDGEKKDAIPEDAINRYESSGIIRFLGMQQEMREVYALMNIFVLPSYREGFPRSAMEAASLGLPLVLANIRGCREAVEDGNNGVLVPLHDAVALCAGIESLVQQGELRERMSRASREKALRDFDERSVIRKTLEVYERLLAARVSPEKGAARAHSEAI